MKSQFGYGGTIHHFKNYLIRNDPKYYDAFHKKYGAFLLKKEEYLAFLNTSFLEKAKLNRIQKVLDIYHSNINKINLYRQQGKSIQEIDTLVRVDNSSALEAMKSLEDSFGKKITKLSQNIDDIIIQIYYIALLVIVLIVGLIIYLGLFFEKTIIVPLAKIEAGLLSFFNFLSNHKHRIEKISLHTKDEFGVMADSINKNIEIASKLHNDIQYNNQELENLIKSYGQNVIASKTDLLGNITYVSEAFEKISGYKKEELLGRSHNILRHPSMPNSVFKELWQTIQKGQIWEGEITNRKKDGSYYLVRAIITPLFNEENKMVGYSAIRDDITDHRKVITLNEQLDTYKNHLEHKVKEATKRIEKLMFEIEDTQKEVVFTMGAIGERRSEETGNHVKRVAEYSKLLALYSGVSKKEAEMLRQASPMHDIGKVGIADSILNKPGKLDDHEYKTMQEHSELGYNMLKSSTRPLLKIAASVAYEHHEKWDGTGYPRGLKGEEIHLYGRITAIADVFDALGSDRVYKKAWSDEKIFTLFKTQRGKHFDPTLIDIFFEHLDEFLAIREKFKDQ
jgi:PAS domain S-box-containing protein